MEHFFNFFILMLSLICVFNGLEEAVVMVLPQDILFIYLLTYFFLFIYFYFLRTF